MTVFKLDRENFQKWTNLLYRCCKKAEFDRLSTYIPEYGLLHEEDFQNIPSIKNIDCFYLDNDGRLLFSGQGKIEKLSELLGRQKSYKDESMKIDEQLKSLMVCLHGDQLFDKVLALRNKNEGILSENAGLSNEVVKDLTELKVLGKISSFKSFRLLFSPEQGISDLFYSPEIGRTVLSRTALFVSEHGYVLESGSELSSIVELLKNYSSFVDSANNFEEVRSYVTDEAKKLGYTDLKSFLPFLSLVSKYNIHSNCSDVFFDLPKIEACEKY